MVLIIFVLYLWYICNTYWEKDSNNNFRDSINFSKFFYNVIDYLKATDTGDKFI